MPLWTPAERAQAADLAALTWANPFTHERVALEHRLLGLPTPPPDAVWHPQDEREADRFARLLALAERLCAAGRQPGPAWDGVAVYALYNRFLPRLTGASGNLPWYGEFTAQAQALLGDGEHDHLLACLIQVRTAFSSIFTHLVGASRPMARLRADCFRSVFGADLRRYRRVLWERMRDFPTLVTGPSGTGKELVARAIGLAGYREVRRGRLSEAGEERFLGLAISALSPALVEAELFGHRRGAFTGAAEERAGWLEVCPEHGCVFLDEIGEVEANVQVKLLRVLQSRRFSRVGESRERRFRGRLIAATNRDLAAEISAGRFRADVYYRLCGDQVRTPALRELLDDDAQELDRLCAALAGGVLGDEEGPAFASEAAAWIRANLGDAYPWPGNVRELEQCLRNLLVRGDYRPARPADDDFAAQAAACRLTADELLDRYCARMHAACGNWREVGRRLGLDWRTAKARAAKA